LLALAALAGCSGPLPLLAEERPGLPRPEARGASPAPEPEVLRLTRNQPGDSKPVVIDADEVYTWNDNGLFVALFRGQVLVQQNVAQARFQQGVAWIDLGVYKRTGILRVQLYAEGQVWLEQSIDTKDGGQRGERAFLDLSTRGELKLHTHKNKVVQKSQADDPLVKRGEAVRGAPAPPPPPAKPSSEGQPGPRTELPRPGGPAPVIQQVAYEEKAPAQTAQGTPGPVVPPVPAPLAPPAPGPPDVPPQVVPPVRPETPVVLPPPTPVTPGPPAVAAPGVAPLPGTVPLPPAREAPPRQFSAVPRQGGTFNIEVVREPVGNGEKAIVVTGGVIINVRSGPGAPLLDIEADRVVVWTRDADPQDVVNNLQTPEGQTSNQLEFYLSGNVELRQDARNGRDKQVLRADEVYYDVNRNVAVALTASLELTRFDPRFPQVTDPIILRADELLKTSATTYELNRAEVFSSKLPSDPGLKVYVTRANVEEKTVPKMSIFGRRILNRTTGEVEQEQQTLVTGRNALLELENIPVLYFPYLSGDVNDPLGPIQDIAFSFSQIFGFEFGVTLNMYDLLGVQAYEGTHWKTIVNYLSYRGPALSTEFTYTQKDFLGIPAKWEGLVRGDSIYDRNFDVLGGPRPVDNFNPVNFRGRLLWRQQAYDLPDGFSFQTQLSPLSDRNYLEQYSKNEFDVDYPARTYAYVKQQQDFWAWTGLVEPRIRNWVTETEALPRFDGYLLGVSLLDRFTSNTTVSGAYLQLRTSNDPEPPVSPTDQNSNSGRFAVGEELSLPLAAGPFKLVPYGKLLLAEYTQDLNGDETGRAWGGLGVRGSIPFSRLYPDVESELFNLKGLYHKAVASGNYFYATTNEPYTRFAQFDRLNDDATDQALRDIKPLEPTFNPAHGFALENSPLYDPQTYAIRRLIMNRLETLDTIEVFQFDLRQRLQTKRGYPGAEHTVDWMTLDLSASYFPAGNRDNFGSNWAFLEYDYVWNVGDRLALESTGWIDPESGGPRVFTVGAFMNRPDRTNFFLGYRQIDLLESRAVTAAVSYVFSAKYSMTAASTYDFGTGQNLSSSLVFTRNGSDLQVSVGVTYNAVTQSFGATVLVIPNLIPPNRRIGALSALGPGSLTGR
jgi:hypothetical protein